ncbi:hypothetical protein, partial [Marinobacter sp.]|uniref:hypothetical protein n=1 Tax=Marinobacter sp. TaxID=50741 RepID=UPI0032992CD2
MERQGWRDRALQGCIHGRFLGTCTGLGQAQIQTLKLAALASRNPQPKRIQLDKAFSILLI